MKTGDVVNLGGAPCTVTALYKDGAVKTLQMAGLNPAITPGYRFANFSFPVHTVTFHSYGDGKPYMDIGFYRYNPNGSIADDQT